MKFIIFIIPIKSLMPFVILWVITLTVIAIFFSRIPTSHWAHWQWFGPAPRDCTEARGIAYSYSRIPTSPCSLTLAVIRFGQPRPGVVPTPDLGQRLPGTPLARWRCEALVCLAPDVVVGLSQREKPTPTSRAGFCQLVTGDHGMSLGLSMTPLSTDWLLCWENALIGALAGIFSVSASPGREPTRGTLWETSPALRSPWWRCKARVYPALDVVVGLSQREKPTPTSRAGFCQLVTGDHGMSLGLSMTPLSTDWLLCWENALIGALAGIFSITPYSREFPLT